MDQPGMAVGNASRFDASGSFLLGIAFAFLYRICSNLSSSMDRKR